ncbi:MAG: aminotransferase class V-fold PLP-dependent enzyme [Ktedonobacteraceae bacterium]|nr:aminotransferase class V-fold PLP-dependent enzyme [Ktedonobacteraceae bacterium]
MLDISHLQRIRNAMPATTSRIYLNTGTFGPLPSCVIEAMQDRMQREWRDGRLGAEVFEATKTIYDQARSSAARLLSADVQEIALTDNTGEGMNSMSYGLNWRAGDEIITTDHEHVGALAPLYQIRDRYGVVLRMAQLGQMAERPAHKAIGELVTERTRLIVLSHVTWTTGTVLDIHAVGGMAHERGIPVLIDGAQSAGAIPVDVTALDIDFYAIPMQKWLCGPDGTGALYIKRESLHYVAPTYVGYYSNKHWSNAEWELQDSAQRFELGGRQTAALAGQCAALNWLEQTVGYPWLFKRISSLHAYAYHALQRVPGLTLLTPVAGISGIVAFSLEGRDSKDVVEQLREKRNIYIRSIPSNNALRISTGFYNTEEEIDTLVETLAKL